MTAAGVGLTPTAASTVLFAELHWTPGVLAQCEDRAHRIGQTNASVQILYMVCKDEKLSVDMNLWTMLGRKIGTLDQVVDGKEEAPYLYNAREGPAPRINHGKSVQDELSDFFAETASDETARQKRPPVMGSIEHYFTKISKKTCSYNGRKELDNSKSLTERDEIK